jgi:hypothetical protein
VLAEHHDERTEQCAPTSAPMSWITYRLHLVDKVDAAGADEAVPRPHHTCGNDAVRRRIRCVLTIRRQGSIETVGPRAGRL